MQLRPPSTFSATALVEADPVPELRNRRLELPVRDAVRRDLRDSFHEKRGSNRQHEAIDIMTPRNTPIVAVEDGTIARLFDSKAGGTTVYQFDPTARYAYYYAHLGRYADGLRERDHVLRGQVLGYAGTSGNHGPLLPACLGVAAQPARDPDLAHRAGSRRRIAGSGGRLHRSAVSCAHWPGLPRHSGARLSSETPTASSCSRTASRSTRVHAWIIRAVSSFARVPWCPRTPSS